jgi:hypothetical protein
LILLSSARRKRPLPKKGGHHLVFPIQKCGFLSKVKEIKRLCGGAVYYAAQASAQIDAEIGQKDHLWMETKYRLKQNSFLHDELNMTN